MIKKFFVGLAILLGLMVIAAIAIPFIFKDEIRAKVNDSINEKLTAKVEFGDFAVGIFKSFPNLSVSMEQLIVSGTDSFATDTLANIKELTIVADLMSVINGEIIQIKNIQLTEPKINVVVLKSGKANWDIMKPDTIPTVSTDTGSTKFSIALRSYELIDATISYDDQSLGFYTLISHANHKGSGDFTQDLFTLVTETDAQELTVSYGGVAYLNKVKTKITAPIEMDMLKSIYTFKENEIKLNDLNLAFDGSVKMPADDIEMDISFDAEKSDFKNFLSLIPTIYASSFSDLKANGKFAMNGYYKGVLNDVSSPGFGLNLLIEDGQFSYPNLPTAVNNVQMILKIDNADGDLNSTLIDLNKLHIEFGKEPFDAKLTLKTPIADPDIDATIKGKIDLATILKIIPIKDTKLSGIINSNVTAKGKLSTIEKGNYESFDAKGNVQISNLNYSSKESPLDFKLISALLLFSPKNITLSNMEAKYGKSDFSATGTLDNYLAYALKGANLKGKLNLKSKLLDVNELMGPSTEEEANPSKNADTLTVVKIPGNIDFELNSSIQKIIYDNMDISNLNGTILLKDETVSFKNVSLNTLDGTVGMNGSYSSKDISKPKVDMFFSIKQMNIQKAFQTFNTVKKLAPIAEKTSGQFNMNLNFNTDMGLDMSPVMSTVEGDGELQLIAATISGSKMMDGLASVLKYDKLKQLSLKDTKIKFKIINGRVVLDPFDLKAGSFVMNVMGSSGLDQSLDYKLKLNLPKGSLGTAANQVLSGLMNQLNKNGASYDPGESINVNALVGGFSSKPTFKLAMADMGAGAKNAIKDVFDSKKKEAIAKGKEEARKKADLILAQAQIQANTVKTESKNLAEKARKEGYSAADKLEKEATNPVAKIAAKKAAEKIRKESDEKANRMISEGDKKADSIMQKARAEADQLLK